MAHHTQSVLTKAMVVLKRSRDELDAFKDYLSQMARSDTSTDANATARSFAPHIAKAENLVAKAEAMFVRIRQGPRVPPRPAASVPASIRAKRALSVLYPAVDFPENERVVRHKPLSPRKYLTSCGKLPASPIRDDRLAMLARRVISETGLGVQIPQKNLAQGRYAVYFICQPIFAAVISFDDVRTTSYYNKSTIDASSTPAPSPPQQQQHSAKQPVFLVPDHVDVFGANERVTPRWSRSEHAVFNVLTERANAAIRYYMAREETGEDAFMAFARWLSRHKTLFGNVCEERRLAFDSSRGIFLPACIVPFDGDFSPRFTRGTIPIRANPSTAPSTRHAQPTGSAAVPEETPVDVTEPAQSMPTSQALQNGPLQGSPLQGQPQAAFANLRAAITAQSTPMVHPSGGPAPGQMNSQHQGSTPSQATASGSFPPHHQSRGNLPTGVGVALPQNQPHGQSHPQVNPPYAQSMTQTTSQSSSQAMAVQASPVQAQQPSYLPSVGQPQPRPNSSAAMGFSGAPLSGLEQLNGNQGFLGGSGTPPSPQVAAAASAAVAAVQTGANPVMGNAFAQGTFGGAISGPLSGASFPQQGNIAQLSVRQIAAQLGGVSGQMDPSSAGRGAGNLPSGRNEPSWNRLQ